jgi:hypothetical protein
LPQLLWDDETLPIRTIRGLNEVRSKQQEVAMTKFMARAPALCLPNPATLGAIAPTGDALT